MAATGEVTVNPETTFNQAGEEHLVCPMPMAAKTVPAGAYSPLNNVMFMPLQNTCAVPRRRFRQDLCPTRPIGLTMSQQQLAPGSGQNRHRSTRFLSNRQHPVEIRAAGGHAFSRDDRRRAVFGGDTNGSFRALDQDTGKVLWEVNLGSPVTGYPITYAGGKQYVAVSTGESLSTDELNALTPELRPGLSNNIFVFALPD